jgi:hypothetical protein
MEEIFQRRFERLRIQREEKRATELRRQQLQAQQYGSHQEEAKR